MIAALTLLASLAGLFSMFAWVALLVWQCVELRKQNSLMKSHLDWLYDGDGDGPDGGSEIEQDNAPTSNVSVIKRRP